MKINYIFFSFLFAISILTAQEAPHSHATGRTIVFPDIPGYKTLICDFHQHSVFSDGSVWPDIRVQESLKDGLDAISITEHLEYQPHKEDIPHPDRNKAYQIARKEAKDHDLLVINGSEITRSMPPGHANAVFIKDANKLLQEDAMTAFKEAKKQDAFVFWNHPNWTSQKPDGIATLTPMHKELLREKLMHGIEVVNEVTYSEEALQIALDNNLTIMGTSDIHGLVDWLFKVPEGGHRPVTLVFAKEKSAQSIKDALFERRTVVYYNNLLIGRDEYVSPLIKASLTMDPPKYQGKSSVLALTLHNQSDVDFTLRNTSKYSLHNHSELVIVKAHSSETLNIKTLKKLNQGTINFEVMNAVLAPKKHPGISFEFKIN